MGCRGVIWGKGEGGRGKRGGRSSKYLDDLVTRELELGDVSRVAGHEVAVEDAENALVRDDEEVVLLALELEDYGL